MSQTTRRPEPSPQANPVTVPASTPSPSSKAEAAKTDARPPHRETLVESLVIALILAILIRGFAAEAFVIPTGSMAPTLMGRHKEVTCPQCGYVYAVNASSEAELGPDVADQYRWVEAGTCTNCRYQARIGGEPSFKGDRILVMKFPYDLPSLPGAGAPERWDVIVFKYPEEPEINYIKRLVGLPGEELRVYFGDIYARPRGSHEPFRLARKPLKHLDAMQMTVYDDRYLPRAFQGRPEWRRWASRTAGAWVEDQKAPGTFEARTASEDWSELRYRHLVPDPEQWDAAARDLSMPHPPRASLITDFYSYNTSLTAAAGRMPSQEYLAPHWVGDLTLSCRLEVTSDTGRVAFELVEGGIRNRCIIDLADGRATLYHGDRALGEPARTTVRGRGWHDIQFANVDGRLTLWVDGHTPFGEGRTYDDWTDTHPIPTEADLDPVGVGLKQATGRVSRLVLRRDIYYTQFPMHSDYQWDLPVTDLSETLDRLSNPNYFDVFKQASEKKFEIGQDRYMVMGDNSPMSKDGRAWSSRDEEWDPDRRETWEVPRSLLIGKAFFVYWPHAKPFGPDIRLTRDIRVPFYPYVQRMKLIH